MPTDVRLQTVYLPIGRENVSPLTRDVQVSQPFDVRDSAPGQGPPTVGGDLALTYHSETVNVKPLIELTWNSDANLPVPSGIQASLSFNGGSYQSPVSFGTSGHAAGDTYLMDLQVNSPVSSTGYYAWQALIAATYSGGGTISASVTGNAAVVANGSSDPYGQGWSIAGLDSLVSRNSGVTPTNGPGSGLLRLRITVPRFTLKERPEPFAKGYVMNVRTAPAWLLVLLLPSVVEGGEKGIDLAAFDARIKPADRRHWAFQPVTRPLIPKVKDGDWARNPIDAFVLAKQEQDGFKPAPPAAPRVLLRRLYLDLVGLPPTLAEQDAFLNDSSPTAVERVVDELLARPAHGERWARHWLDLVRYAETNGYERDAARPFVWRYRDYVIRTFNADKPFDRFVLEQLAGDELADADSDAVVATGYYRLGPWDDEPADPQEDRFDQLDDLVSTTSLAFLGLTIGCARCHDHKFDPVTMHDYYRMVAIFNPLQRPRNGRTELTLPAIPRRSSAKGAPSPPQGYFMHEPSPRPPETHMLIRGKAARPGPRVQPGVPAVLVAAQPHFPPPDAYTSLRRLTLARWIASRDNPLTARVWVNRVWQHHFGEGLVRSPSDFGVMGRAPTHPELLDWLADWFVVNGWSTRKLHRLILTSNTYRMSTAWNKQHGDRDAENVSLWRFPYRRLDVEVIRDAMLSVGGTLNTQMHGPWVYPEVPKEALAGSSDPDKIWKAFDEREASRRTIYAHVKRSLVVPLLEVLDLCDTTRSSERRLVTTVAPQALSLFNGSFANRQARHFAERLVREVGDDPDKQIERAYRLALSRPPTDMEQRRLAAFLEREYRQLMGSDRKQSPRQARRMALEQMCRVIFNLNEFVYAD